jgi:hypothetical protein
VWNHGLGKASQDNTPTYNRFIQSSRQDVATPLDTSSSLLGLQLLNSDNARDSITNRPQLNTTWRREGDNFAGADGLIYQVSDDNSNSGTRARTG